MELYSIVPSNVGRIAEGLNTLHPDPNTLHGFP